VSSALSVSVVQLADRNSAEVRNGRLEPGGSRTDSPGYEP